MPDFGWFVENRDDVFGALGARVVPPDHHQRVEDGDSESSGSDNRNLIKADDIGADFQKAEKFVEQGLRIKSKDPDSDLYESVRKILTKMNRLTNAERLERHRRQQRVQKIKEERAEQEKSDDDDDDDEAQDENENENDNENTNVKSRKRKGEKAALKKQKRKERQARKEEKRKQREKKPGFWKTEIEATSTEPSLSVTVSPVKGSGLRADDGERKGNEENRVDNDSNDPNVSFRSDLSMGMNTKNLNISVSLGSSFAPDSVDGDADEADEAATGDGVLDDAIDDAIDDHDLYMAD